MSKTFQNPLPKHEPLPGAVVAQFRPYKDNLLGPYWFRVWREQGRVKKAYVRRTELSAVRAACGEHQSRRRAEAARRREFAKGLSDFSFTLRLLTRFERLPEGANDYDHVSEAELSRLERLTRMDLR